MGIGIYVIGYQLIIQKQYIKKTPIRGGTIHATLHPSLAPVAVDLLRYCSQSSRPLEGALPCTSPSGSLQAVGGRLLIGTRLSRIAQWRESQCGDVEYGCQQWRDAKRSVDTFLGDIESAIVVIQHDISDQDARETCTPQPMI